MSAKTSALYTRDVRSAEANEIILDALLLIQNQCASMPMECVNVPNLEQQRV